MDLSCATPLKSFLLLNGAIHLLHADSDPWLPFSWVGIQLSQEEEQERLEGWFKFSVQISLLELVYSTKCWLCGEFSTKCWLLLLIAWNGKDIFYFVHSVLQEGIILLSQSARYYMWSVGVMNSLASSASVIVNIIQSVIWVMLHGESVKLLLLLSVWPYLPRHGWALVQIWEAEGGDQLIETPPLHNTWQTAC